MSRILRRPMFRGGKVSSYGTGIASGLGRQGYEPGGRVMEVRENILKQIPQQKGLSTSDYLRIASAGLDILGAPSEGGGIKGALATVSKPLSKLGVDMATSIDKRGQAREDLATSLTGAGLEYEIGMAKANKLSATEVSLNVVDKFYNPQIEAEEDPIKKQSLTEKRDRAKLDIAQGGNKASKFRFLQSQVEAAQDLVSDKLEEELGREPTLQEIEEAVANYLISLVSNIDAGLAEGGSVTENMNVMTATPAGMTDVNVEETETVNEPQPMQVSYDELRARLPKQITDDIVNLLAESYEALADFAQIATQSDVDNFNSKYGVELVLPQEA